MKLGIAGSGNIVPVFLDAYREAFASPVYALCGREKSRARLEELKQSFEIGKIFTVRMEVFFHYLVAELDTFVTYIHIRSGD